jgi:hypothetical protein
LFIAAIALLCLWAPRVHAQDYDAAGRHFASGQERFAQKKFHTAAMEFQAAYDITKDPVLLYNVGESWQKAGEAQRAIDAFRAYLKERGSEAKDRADVDKRVAQLETHNVRIGDTDKNPKKPKTPLLDQSTPGDQEEAAQWMAAGGPPSPTPAPAPTAEPAPAPSPSPPPSTSPPPPPPPEPAVAPPPPPPAPAPQIGLLDDRPASKLRIAAWASVAATIALLTTGAILGLAAQSRADEISRRLNFVDSSGQPREFDPGARSDFQSLKDEGHLYNGLAIGFYSAAGAMAITTTVLFVVDWKQGKAKKALQHARALHLAPAVGPGSAGLVLGGAF